MPIRVAGESRGSKMAGSQQNDAMAALMPTTRPICLTRALDKAYSLTSRPSPEVLIAALSLIETSYKRVTVTLLPVKPPNLSPNDRLTAWMAGQHKESLRMEREEAANTKKSKPCTPAVLFEIVPQATEFGKMAPLPRSVPPFALLRLQRANRGSADSLPCRYLCSHLHPLRVRSAVCLAYYASGLLGIIDGGGCAQARGWGSFYLPCTRSSQIKRRLLPKGLKALNEEGLNDQTREVIARALP